jgi:hypothetical protein
MASNEDYGKYFCALGSRSVIRVAAKVYAVNLDQLFDATKGVDALREVDWDDEEEDR